MEISIEQITNFYKQHPECMGDVLVETRHGYYPINAAEITAYNSEVYKVVTESLLELKCSPDHRLLDESLKWVHTKNIKVGDYITTKNGKERVIEITLLDYKDDLYDIEVDDKHEYYSNGIVSHNSSLIDAIMFVFYGKAFRDIKKDLLVNSTNKKGLLVECKLIGNNGKNVLVRRGMKPHVFEIYEDDVLVNQNAKSIDYQLYLETYIIGMNASTFSQTVLISKTKYTPFMRLRAGERRQFVESILGIEILGEMQKLQNKIISGLKDKESELKTNIRLNENDFSNKIESIKRYNKLILEAKQESVDAINSEINSINSKINDHETKIETLKNSIKSVDYSQKIDLYKRIENRLTTEQYSLDSLIRDKSKIEKNNTGLCGTCGSKIDTSHIQKHINEIDLNIEKHKSNIEKLKNKRLEIKPYIEKSELQTSHNDSIKAEINTIKRLIENHRGDIKKLSNKTVDTSIYDEELSLLKEQGRELKKKIDESHVEMKNLLQEIDNNNFAASLLKDSGIKAAIIQNNIPTINDTMNEYLHKFGFFINFELDSEFNETIHFKGVNHLQYNSFSEGEKLRIDLALILAWRKVALNKSGMSCNLLFFDEIVDASMDIEGVEMFAKLINSLHQTHSWIITHTPEKIENYVRGYITLEKVDGFTIIQSNK